MKSFESPGAGMSLSAMGAGEREALEDGELVYHKSVPKDVYREGEKGRERGRVRQFSTQPQSRKQVYIH